MEIPVFGRVNSVGRTGGGDIHFFDFYGSVNRGISADIKAVCRRAFGTAFHTGLIPRRSRRQGDIFPVDIEAGGIFRRSVVQSHPAGSHHVAVLIAFSGNIPAEHVAEDLTCCGNGNGAANGTDLRRGIPGLGNPDGTGIGGNHRDLYIFHIRNGCVFEYVSVLVLRRVDDNTAGKVTCGRNIHFQIGNFFDGRITFQIQTIGVVPGGRSLVFHIKNSAVDRSDFAGVGEQSGGERF